jgi:CheY-like chemotaxis protein
MKETKANCQMGNLDSVYVIDDDEIIKYLTGKIIEKVDFAKETKTFENGLQAIEELMQVAQTGAKPPDVILFDLNMPVMDGWEFVERFMQLELPFQIPLFVFTSSINPEDQVKSYKYAKYIRGFITKPLTVVKLNKIARLVT